MDKLESSEWNRHRTTDDCSGAHVRRWVHCFSMKAERKLDSNWIQIEWHRCWHYNTDCNDLVRWLHYLLACCIAGAESEIFQRKLAKLVIKHFIFWVHDRVNMRRWSPRTSRRQHFSHLQSQLLAVTFVVVGRMEEKLICWIDSLFFHSSFIPYLIRNSQLYDGGDEAATWWA